MCSGGGLPNSLYYTENNCLFYAACTKDWVACSTQAHKDETACDVEAVNECVVKAAAWLNEKYGDSTKNPGCAGVVNMYREAFGA